MKQMEQANSQELVEKYGDGHHKILEWGYMVFLSACSLGLLRIGYEVGWSEAKACSNRESIAINS